MPDHFFDELDRFEVDLFADFEGQTIRDKLRNWLKFQASPLQEVVAEEKVEQLRGIAEELGFTIDHTFLREGVRLVERAVLRDARGRFVARGGSRIARYLREEVGF